MLTLTSKDLSILISWLAFIMVLSGFPGTVSGQSPYKVYYHTTENGLPHNTITCITKDSRGFLWLGTPGGLCRFDGYQVKVYRSITNNNKTVLSTINAICEDNYGNLWIGSNKGLLYFVFEQEKLIEADPVQNRIFSKKIKSLWSDKHKIWMATENGAFSFTYALKNDKPEIQEDSIREFLKQESFNTINCTPTYGLLFGAVNGLYCYDTLTQQIISVEKINRIFSISSADIRSIYEAKDRSLWIGTFYGLYHQNYFTGKTDYFLHIPDNNSTISHSTIRAITEDSKGNLLIGNLGGLDVYDSTSNTFKRFSALNQEGYYLNNIFVSALCTDAYGNVWVGTDKGGLNHYNVYQKPFFCYVHDPKISNSLSHSTVNSICEHKNILWIGTAGGGLNRLNLLTGKYTHFRYDLHNQSSISSDFISALFVDRKENLWVGTWGGGINRLSPGQHHSFERFYASGIPFSLSNNFISTIIAFNDSYLVIGTEGGINFYNQKSGRFYYVETLAPDGAKITEVGCLLKDKNGNLWAGSRRGLYKIRNIQFSDNEIIIKPENIQLFKETGQDNDIKGNYITTIIEAGNGIIWIGTYGNGINSCSSLKSGNYIFKNYTEQDGLCNNSVYCIEEDNSGKLWISTDNGLSRFDPVSEEFKEYYENDGLLSSQFYWAASFRNKEGKLYFGNMAGLNYFAPNEMIDYPYVPEVVFTDFKIFNESVSIGQKRNHYVPLIKSISATDAIKISYRDNVFSIEFAALNYFLPDKIMYAYKMEGVDKDWVYVPSSRRFATYTNLKGGSYLFQVKAINSDGISSYTPKTLRVTVMPPFWETLWFKLFMALVLVISIFVYVKYRTHYLHEQKEKLEKLVNERTAKIDEQKKKLELQARHLMEINRELELHQQQIEGQKQELEIKNRKILQQRDELIVLNKKVRSISQLRLRFFTNISHEFRTPLTLILGPLETLNKLIKPDTEAGQLIYTIRKSADRLLHLINQLMLFRRLEEGKMKIQVVRKDIAEFVGHLVHSFDDLAKQKNITYKLNIAKPPYETWFDEEKLEIVLYNLISNAFKYTFDHGRIDITLSFIPPKELIIEDNEGTNYCYISVKDTGVGISRDNQNKIFTRFYRANTQENTNIKGSGLGLAFAHELIEAMHGNIYVESEPGKGSTFLIKIPCTKDSFNVNERTIIAGEKQFDLQSQMEMLRQELIHQENNIHTDGQVKIKSAPSILVVEDSYDLRSFIAKSLRYEYRVLEASNGKEALTIAQKYFPDLIISDVMMPVMDGLEFTTRIKNNFTTSHIPVILLTARTLLENWIEGLETGADDYIPKPFNLKILEAKCRSLIENRKRLRKIFAQSLNPLSKDFSPTKLDEQFINKTIKIIEENIINSGFSVQKLANELCVSRSLLHKKLTALTGLSANDFITSIRLKKSAVLLLQGDKNVSEVAFEAGFNDPKYFSRCFRKHFGMSPTEYLNVNIPVFSPGEESFKT
jgi:signal transduction histidine kinase/ligand-binding sensor domain-containing protein/DNA-binding response OmpR family regulator